MAKTLDDSNFCLGMVGVTLRENKCHDYLLSIFAYFIVEWLRLPACGNAKASIDILLNDCICFESYL